MNRDDNSRRQCVLIAGGDGSLCVAVEYAPHGNLRDFLRRNRPNSVSGTASQCQQCLDETVNAICHKVPLTSRHLLSFARQTARGMQFLASNKVRFFKPCVSSDT